MVLLVCCFLLCVTAVQRINDTYHKLDELCVIDTVYVDVDDMAQMDWQSYTPVDSIT